MSEEQINPQPIKKIKMNVEDQQNEKQWIVVKKKTTPLTISISDHSKVNRFYNHKSIQKYIRYLLTETCPNPMWLAIKRQSQIQHIYYIDIEIQDYLFQKMIEEKTLPFLSSMITIDNKAVFKQQKLNRYVWDSLLIYDEEQKMAKEQLLHQIMSTDIERKMSSQIYKKYLANILTPQEMKENLYPDLRLPLYQRYHSTIPREELIKIQVEKKIEINEQNQKYFQDKNLILVIDCEMVTTGAGFELARCTILNYEEEVIFDNFFKPKNPILNYNTQYSGITKEILDPVTNTIQSTLHPFLDTIITKHTILIGHSLQNDFNAMQYYHPKVVDTSILFIRKNGSKMKLKNLADKLLNRKIQSGTHCSKEDCLATLHLVQARLQNQKMLDFQKQYHLLRDVVNAKHGILIVDHEIDNLKRYNSIHLEKVQQYESPENICEIIKKYSNKAQVSVPKLALTKFQKPQDKEWENYYSSIDSSIQKLYSVVPTGTVFFLNFQINQIVRIVPFTPQQSKKQRSRPFLIPLPKN